MARRTTRRRTRTTGTASSSSALEANSRVYAYALNHADQRVHPDRVVRQRLLAGVMALDWEEEKDRLWVVCDDTCGGVHGTFAIDTAAGRRRAPSSPRSTTSARPGCRTSTTRASRPRRAPSASEGSSRSSGPTTRRPAATRSGQGTLSCTPRVAQTVAFTSTAPTSPVVGQTYTAAATGGASGNPVVLSIAAALVRRLLDHRGGRPLRPPGQLRGPRRPGGQRRLRARLGPADDHRRQGADRDHPQRDRHDASGHGDGAHAGSRHADRQRGLPGRRCARRDRAADRRRRDAEPRRPERRHATHRRVVPGRHRLQLLGRHDQPAGPVDDGSDRAGRPRVGLRLVRRAGPGRVHVRLRGLAPHLPGPGAPVELGGRSDGDPDRHGGGRRLRDRDRRAGRHRPGGADGEGGRRQGRQDLQEPAVAALHGVRCPVGRGRPARSR